jgi:hypothetical protein
MALRHHGLLLPPVQLHHLQVLALGQSLLLALLQGSICGVAAVLELARLNSVAVAVAVLVLLLSINFQIFLQRFQ